MSKAVKTSKPRAMSRAALTAEGQEDKLVSLAADLVEQRLRDGTATSQETTTILKLGMRAHRLELQLMEQELELRRAKTEAIKASKTRDELYDKVMKAMRRYQGAEEEEDQNDEY